LPAAVRVTDFGIRGFDLAYALQDGYDAIILVDAYPHGQPPGTVYVVEPDLDALTSANDVEVDTHGMNPMRVLRLAASMGARPKRVLLLGCEPKSLGGEDGQMGLTAAVEAAVDEAVRRIELLVVQILQGKWPGSPDESP
jgi:hydrogenase maturation protease